MSTLAPVKFIYSLKDAWNLDDDARNLIQNFNNSIYDEHTITALNILIIEFEQITKLYRLDWFGITLQLLKNMVDALITTK